MLKLENITIGHGEATVLDNVTYTFEKGSITGIVAPRGTGKSRLLNVLMNKEQPSTGAVVVKEDLTYVNKRQSNTIQRLMTVMPAITSLYPQLTGRAHLKLYHALWRKTADNVETVIKQLEMSTFINQRVATYSLGMKQCLAFAMLMVANPPIMLCDHMMDGLDPELMELVIRILMRKRAEGKTIIVASHQLQHLERYADAIIFLYDRKIEQVYHTKEREASLRYLKLPNIEHYGESMKSIKESYAELEIEQLSNGMVIVAQQRTPDHQWERLCGQVLNEWHLPVRIEPLTLEEAYLLVYGSKRKKRLFRSMN